MHTNHFGGLGRWNDLGAPGNSPHHLNPYHGIIERSNQPSAADASMDQTVDEGVLVALNGRDSCDAFGSILTYSWTQAAGPAVVLSDRWPSSRRVKRDQAKGVGRAGGEKCGESFGRERSLYPRIREIPGKTGKRPCDHDAGSRVPQDSCVWKQRCRTRSALILHA